ncbi:hypothetical protein ACFWUP_30255 [Nocardia sp. NPDC058658]|uniref:hypothetical protein n=1 Tax=Nocardia sp. NPDC058658 TaxID=3346580 RepID=UPI00365DA3F1
MLDDRVRELLTGPDGHIRAQLQPLAQALSNTDRPFSMLNWLRRGQAAEQLAMLVGQQTDITHESLDALDQTVGTRYVRAHLVATGILIARNEHIAQLRLWTGRTLSAAPSHQLRHLRPFAEWHVLRDGRRRADHGNYTDAAAVGDRADITAALKLLAWLDDNDIIVANLTQSHIDEWLAEHPTRQRATGSFVRWLVARNITGSLDVPVKKRGDPTQFIDDEQMRAQLHRCLTDVELPLEVRVCGALIRLYALPVARILEFTSGQFHRDDNDAYLTIDRHPVLLPPALAQLMESLVAQRPSSLISHDAQTAGYLFPGKLPNRPRHALTFTAHLRKHGLATIAARNTAMIDAVTQMPPIVVSDLFGLSPSTAIIWARYAQASWSDYLAARARNADEE